MPVRESDLFKQVIAAANHCNVTVYRNNSGGFKDATGRFVRFGLGVGSSDLIGYSRGQDSQGNGILGGTIVCIEIKKPGFKPSGEKQKAHYERQKKFIDDINAAGGRAGFVSSYEETVALLKG